MVQEKDQVLLTFCTAVILAFFFNEFTTLIFGSIPKLYIRSTSDLEGAVSRA